MPSRFPNILVNGSSGIAVGMATNIPPHNLCEIVDGVIALIDNPEITNEELMEYTKKDLSNSKIYNEFTKKVDIQSMIDFHLSAGRKSGHFRLSETV